MKKLKRVVSCTLMAVITMTLLISGRASATENNKKIKSISWTDYDKALTIKKGEKVKLGVTFSPKKKINKTLKWTSSKKKVVSVSNKGVIKGKKKGTATITAEATDGSNKKLKLKVTVGTKVSDIVYTNTRDGSMDKLYIGKTYTIKTRISPSNASNKKLKWSSSDEDIAKVNSRGVVKPVQNGVAIITAEAADGSGVICEEQFEVATLVSSVSISLKEETPYQVSLGSEAAYVKGLTEFSLKPTFSPSDATEKGLIYTSSNENVARVTNDGKVLPLKSGIAVITATTIDGSKKSSKFTLFVSEIGKDECTFVAHRGYSEKAPDNSLAAFRLAMENGFEYVELDVWPTTDGQFAVCHNNSLSESTGDDVNITDITLAQAMNHRINKGNGIDTYSGEYIPSLEQVLALASQYQGSKLNIELKDTLTDVQLKSFLELIKKYDMMERVRIISFKKANLTNIRNLDEYNGKDIPLGYLTHTLDQESIDICEQLNAEVGVTYIQVTKDVVKMAHDKGVRVNAWTVPDIYTAEFLIETVKVDSITANYKFFE